MAGVCHEGYIDYCPYGSLHSTGMLECEAPTFTVDNKRVIEENMAICIDAYFKGGENKYKKGNVYMRFLFVIFISEDFEYNLILFRND